MVDPASIPRIDGDMAALAGHADAIAAAGTAIAATGEAVHSTWQGLAPVYIAPEAGQLLAATGPVATGAASIGEDLATASTVLHDYAADAALIQARFEALRVQATELVAEVAAAQDESTLSTLDGRGAELSGQVAAEIAAWEAAQARCAGALGALSGVAPLTSGVPVLGDVVASAAAADPTGPPVTADAAVLAGMPMTSGFAADPVCTATGHLVEVEVDLDAPPTAGLLVWTRVYGSRHVETGPFGRGWWSWASARIEPVHGGVRFTGPDGRRARFSRAGRAGYARVPGIAGLLTDNPDGGWVLDWFAGDTWRFDPWGRPVAVEDGFGTTRLQWSDGRLVAMVAPTGRRLDLGWQHDRIVTARTSDGRVAHYRYDAAGDLIDVRRPAGGRRYTVDERGLIVVVTDADGVEEVRNTYDELGRVRTQRSPFGRLTRFTYRSDRSTVVDDDLGGPRTTYFHDDHGRLTGMVDDHGARMVKFYDRWGSPTAIADRAGAVVGQEFDDRGNLVRRREPDGATTTQEWDALDRLVRRTDPTGATVELQYTGRDREPSVVVDPLGARTRLDVVAGLVMRIVDPDGVTTRFDRDRDGRVVGVTDGTGAVTRFGYDAAGQLTSVTGPDGATTSYTRDGAGRLVSERDGAGAVTRYEWSAAGRALVTVSAVGGVTRREYGPHGEQVAITDPGGGVSRLEWDALGRMVRLTNPAGAKLEHRHDGLGRLVAVDDPAGGRTLREHDAEGRVVAVVDATGRRRSRELDLRGRTVAESDGVGTVRHTHDAAGRRTRTVDAEGGALTVTFDLAGRPVTATDPTGAVTTYEWSPGGRLLRRVSPLGHVTSWSYDAAGRAVAEIGPGGRRREVDLDPSGRVVAARSPGGDETRLSYDAVGRPVMRRDPHGGLTAFAHDPVGRIVAVTDAGGGTARYEWSVGGRLTGAVDPSGGATRFVYDPAGQLVEATDPLGGRQTHRYDEVGRLVGFTDQRGSVTSLELDPAGRLLARTDATGATLRLSYDGAGRVRAWESGGQRTEIHRDRSGRPVRFVEPSGRTTMLRHDRRGHPVRWACEDVELSWMWDADGRRTAVVHPDGSTTDYEHDPAGDLVGVEHPLLGRITITRDADGRPTHLDGPGHTRRWTWRSGLLAAYASDGVEIELGHDAAGRVVREGRRTYRYDAAGRLVEARDGGDPPRTWTYDRAGRRLTDGDRRFRYDAAHRLTGIDDPSGHTTLTWDDAGRRTGEQRSDGSTVAYGWDPLGRLNRVSRSDGTDVRLDVDARGDLRGVGGTGLVWDHSGAVPQVRQLGDTPVVGSGAPLGHGDTLLRPDVHGDLGDARDPWGLPTAPGGVPQLGYRGELEFGGLVWLRHRVYDPSTAGFLSPDPLPPLLGSATTSPYAYAGNDPVGAIDPLGLQPMTDADAAQMREAQDRPWWDQALGWAGDNLDTIAAVGLGVVGVGLIATGVGAPIGAGILIGMGASAGIQASTTGQVDARQLWVSGLAGGLSGGVGGAVSGAGGGILAQGVAGVGTGAVTSVGSQVIVNGGRVDPAQVGIDGALGGLGGTLGPAIGRLRGGAVPPVVAGAHEPADVTLYRNVIADEFDSIASTGRFELGTGNMEGKWFALSGEDADQWGRLLNGGQGVTVQKTVPKEVEGQLYRHHNDKLDGVGPGVYAQREQLDWINASGGPIELWP